MTGKQGMDVVAVRAVADDFGRAGDRLRAVVTEVDGAMSTAWWQGHDAEAFRSNWSTRQRTTLNDVATRLADLRASLRRQARDQEVTSDGIGAFGGPPVAAFLPFEQWIEEARAGAGELGRVLRDLGGNAEQWLEWLAGPEGPSIEDATKLVPGLQRAIGDGIDAAMEQPPIAGVIGKLFGFEYVGEPHDFYTTNEHSLQSHLGFHDLYDKLHKLGGMDLDDEVVTVEVKGVEYRLELWRGGYGSGGAFGGEIGLYTRRPDEGGLRGLLEKIPGYYSSADGDDQIKMTQTIYNTKTGEEYFTNDGKGADDGEHYWNLAIRTDPTVPHEDLGQKGTLVIEDADLRDALVAQMQAQGLQPVVNPDGSVSYTWEH